jgi:hypothetical protein
MVLVVLGLPRQSCVLPGHISTQSLEKMRYCHTCSALAHTHESTGQSESCLSSVRNTWCALRSCLRTADARHMRRHNVTLKKAAQVGVIWQKGSRAMLHWHQKHLGKRLQASSRICCMRHSYCCRRQRFADLD